MNLYVIMSCFFQRITELNPVTGEVIPSTSHGYGLIARELATQMGETQDMASYQSCIIYPSDEYDYISDFWMVTARNMGFLAGLLGLIAWVFFILAYCFLFTPWTMERWVMWIYLWAAMSMALTMLMWGGSFCKENKCQVAPGTGYAISSFFTFLMLANQAKSMAQPPAAEQEMPEPGGREDDYWYDDEDERFHMDSDQEEEDSDDDSGGNIEVFEDEDIDPNRKRKVGFAEEPAKHEEGQFQNGQRVQNDYEDMSEFMAPEDRYAQEQDERFLEYDQELYHQQAQQQQQQADHNQPQAAPHWRQHPPAQGQQPPAGNYGAPNDDDDTNERTLI